MDNTKIISPATILVAEEPERWNALFQVNRVPPWPIFTESVMKVCDNCPLYVSASADNCLSCPLVEFIEKTLTAVDIGVDKRKRYAPVGK